MIIEDLDQFEPVLEVNSIIGGEYPITSTNTFATFGFAYADANANAWGQQTSTQTNTSTTVYVDPYVAFSQASALGRADARTDGNHYWSQSDSLSLFLSTNPW
jgi:hypothetical protein